jgi:dephospho-CoA kinase
MIVGLTGGIGSGKTTLAKLFEVMGCAIYNSDDRAKEVYFNPEVRQQVIELLGKEAYRSEQEIDKPFISSRIFSDTRLLQQLNSIIHPAVKTDFIEFTNQYAAHKIIIKESAILFETGIYKDLEKTILVTAPPELKLKRVMQRNAVTKEEVEKRMSAQWSDEQKIALADFVITNDDQQALIPQVAGIIQKLNHA